MTPAGADQLQPPPVHLNPARRWTPWLVPAASVACVMVFLLTMFVDDCTDRGLCNCFTSFLGRFSFQHLKENPLLGPSSTALLKMGALDVSRVVHGREGWRLFTCIWLHAGVIHLLINVLCLIFIGIPLEQEFGFVRIGIVYAVSGLGASLMSALFLGSNISVGASGALFGLIGSTLSWTLYTNKVAALFLTVFVIVVDLALGIYSTVDNFAHIGGLISGFLLGFVVFIRPQFVWLNQNIEQTAPVERKHKTYQYVLWIVSALMLIVGFTVAVLVLFLGYNGCDHSAWCHYMRCVPTKKWKSNSSPTTYTMGHFFGLSKGDLSALEIGLIAGGAVAVAVLAFVLYKACVRWATRRRAAVARRSAVKTIKGVALADLRGELAPGNEPVKCAICLEEYEDDDEVAKLDCGHHYHDRCVRRWVARGRPTCPLCVASVV